MSKKNDSAALKALKKLTPSRHGKGSTMPLDAWVKQLNAEDYLKIPVYHSTATRPEEFKSQKVRVALLSKVTKFFYHHAVDADGFRYIIVMKKSAAFDELGWSYTEAVSE